jgi:roadblock/LC7 domain-containing protein
MTGRKYQEHNTVLAAGDFQEETQHMHTSGKLSSAMAMLLGVFVTAEIMIAGAMLFNIDIHAADTFAVFLGFLVLYFGVVACLTDK